MELPKDGQLTEPGRQRGQPVALESNLGEGGEAAYRLRHVDEPVVGQIEFAQRRVGSDPRWQLGPSEFGEAQHQQARHVADAVRFC
jgi:hypothetical protein